MKFISPGFVRCPRCNGQFDPRFQSAWCGKKVRKATIRNRPGWADLPAVRDGHIYEIKSTYILQPGPAALTEGVRQIHALLALATGQPVDPALAPDSPLDPDAGERD